MLINGILPIAVLFEGPLQGLEQDVRDSFVQNGGRFHGGLIP